MRASEFETGNPHSVVTGRDKGTCPRLPVMVAGHRDKESRSPSLNDDATAYSNGYGFHQKVNFCTATSKAGFL